MKKEATSLNELLSHVFGSDAEIGALRSELSDRDFVQHAAELVCCDHTETTTPHMLAGGRNERGCRSDADWAAPSECYRRFFIARKGDFIPKNGYDRLIVVCSLDLQEIYVQQGGRGRQKLVSISDLVRIMARLGETGEVKL